MLKTVSNLKDSVSGILNGLNLDDVNDIDGVIERAARIVIGEISIPEASGKLSTTLYDGVFDYEAPDTIFGTSLIDFRPQGISRNESQKAYKRTIELFDRTKHTLPNGYKLTFEYDEGTPIMRVASPTPTGMVEIDPLDDDDWTLSGSASGLIVDENVYYESPSSLRFLLTGSSTGVLSKTIDSLDIDEYEDLGVAFLAIRTPSASSLTSITLRLGSSDSVYDAVTSTEGFLGAWKTDKWLLVPFDFSGATSTGAPDWDAIDYAQIRIAHTATLTNFRIGKLFMSLPSPHELIYETAAIFKATGASPLQTISSDADTIILSDPAYTIFEFETARQVSLEIGGTRGGKTLSRIDLELDGNGVKPGLYARFREVNPSLRIKEDNTYYPVRGYRRK